MQLYAFPTPNGLKISIALEEMSFPYDYHRIDISKGDQFRPEFIEINPNSKIPALVDPKGPGGKRISIMESGAILTYLAQKSGQFWSDDPAEQSEILQWLFFQVGGVGPMFGQFGHFFKYATAQCEHPYPVERYKKEVRRLLGVLNTRLESQGFLAAKRYTIADMATMPWVRCLRDFYGAQDVLGLSEFRSVNVWVEDLSRRPQTKKGLSLA